MQTPTREECKESKNGPKYEQTKSYAQLLAIKFQRQLHA